MHSKNAFIFEKVGGNSWTIVHESPKTQDFHYGTARANDFF
jgi:hypothetical protein